MTIRDALFERFIDYAGTFPPAKLPPDEAFARYIELLNDPRRSFIVGSLAWAADDLDRLAQLVADSESIPEDGFGVAVIGKAVERSEWDATREKEVAALGKFDQQCPDACWIQSYEVRIPDVNHTASDLKVLSGCSEIDIYLEIPHGLPLEDAIGAIADTEFASAKFRTGGTIASAYPSALNLAEFLHICDSSDVAFKLTAGLHSGIAHHDSSLAVHSHGFLNVIAAVGHCITEDATIAEVEHILLNHHLSVESGPDVLRLGGIEINTELVEDIRSVFDCIGSCSVDEPLESLDHLGVH